MATDALASMMHLRALRPGVYVCVCVCVCVRERVRGERMVGRVEGERRESGVKWKRAER